MTNSLEHTHQGIIELRIQKIKRNCDDEIIEFTLKDNGKGMSEDDLSGLYQPFCKTHHTLDNHIGLGLWIVQNLLSLMDGTIDIQSVPNEGTCVTLVIPLQVKKQYHTSHDITTQHQPMEMSVSTPLFPYNCEIDTDSLNEISNNMPSSSMSSSSSEESTEKSRNKFLQIQFLCIL